MSNYVLGNLFPPETEISLDAQALDPKDFSNRTLVAKVLLLGGGVQSGTLVEMIAEGFIDKPDIVVFADTGDEPWWVHQMIHRYRSRLKAIGVDMISCRRDRGDLISVYSSLKADIMAGRVTTSMPLYVKDRETGKRGRLKRQCTEDYKVTPNNKAIREWLLTKGWAKTTQNAPWRWSSEINALYQSWQEFGVIGGQFVEDFWSKVIWQRPVIGEDFYGNDDIQVRVRRDVYVEMWFGISADELYRATERGPQWQKTVYPLIDLGMTREDCVRWLQERKLPVPLKSACMECPYKSDASWYWLENFDPEVFEEVCVFDDWLRSPEVINNLSFAGIRGELYLHRLLLPLREINFETLVNKPQRKAREHEMAGELMFDVCSTDGAWSCFS